MLWNRCKGEGGQLRDLFGWTGSELERPWAWGALCDARDVYEAQERAMGMYLKQHPIMGGWQYPHYPPSDRTRTNGLWFARWVAEQEALQWKATDETHKRELADLERVWLVTRQGEQVELLPNSADPDEAVYLFWDGGVVDLVGVDRYGVIAESIVEQPAQREEG